MTAVHDAIEQLAAQETGLRALLLELGLLPRLEPLPLLRSKRRVEQHIAGDLKDAIEVLRQRGARHRGIRRRETGRQVEDAGDGLQLLRQLHRRQLRGALAHHGGGVAGQAGSVGGVVVAAGPRDDDLEGDSRHTAIFQHHQVKAVRQIAFLRAR